MVVVSAGSGMEDFNDCGGWSLSDVSKDLVAWETLDHR